MQSYSFSSDYTNLTFGTAKKQGEVRFYLLHHIYFQLIKLLTGSILKIQ